MTGRPTDILMGAAFSALIALILYTVGILATDAPAPPWTFGLIVALAALSGAWRTHRALLLHPDHFYEEETIG